MNIVRLSDEDMPKCADLPGDLARIALTLEGEFPGQGARITLTLAQLFGGQHLYIRKADTVLRRARDRAIRRRYDRDDVTVSQLVTMFGLSSSHIFSILGRPDENGKLAGQLELPLTPGPSPR